MKKRQRKKKKLADRLVQVNKYTKKLTTKQTKIDMYDGNSISNLMIKQ